MVEAATGYSNRASFVIPRLGSMTGLSCPVVAHSSVAIRLHFSTIRWGMKVASAAGSSFEVRGYCTCVVACVSESWVCVRCAATWACAGQRLRCSTEGPVCRAPGCRRIWLSRWPPKGLSGVCLLSEPPETSRARYGPFRVAGKYCVRCIGGRKQGQGA